MLTALPFGSESRLRDAKAWPGRFRFERRLRIKTRSLIPQVRRIRYSWWWAVQHPDVRPSLLWNFASHPPVYTWSEKRV